MGFAFTPAQAVVIATFTTHVSRLLNYQDTYGDLAVGDLVTLTYRYDPDVNPDSRYLFGSSEYYHYGQNNDSPITVTASFGGRLATISPSVIGQIDLFNDYPIGEPSDGTVDIWSASVAQSEVANGVRTDQVWYGAAIQKEIEGILNPLRNLTYVAVTDSKNFSVLQIFTEDIATGRTDYQEVSLALEKLIVVNLSAVPEPATWAMMLAGFGAVGAAVRRSRGRPANRSSACSKMTARAT
jgi:hypothetical protein